MEAIVDQPAKRVALAAVLAENKAPSHCDRASVHAQLAPILAIGAAAQKQMVEYRALVMQLELGADPDLAGAYEYLHQTIAAAEREAIAFVQSGRQLAKAFNQLDRYLTDGA